MVWTRHPNVFARKVTVPKLLVLWRKVRKVTKEHDQVRQPVFSDPQAKCLKGHLVSIRKSHLLERFVGRPLGRGLRTCTRHACA